MPRFKDTGRGDRRQMLDDERAHQHAINQAIIDRAIQRQMMLEEEERRDRRRRARNFSGDVTYMMYPSRKPSSRSSYR